MGQLVFRKSLILFVAAASAMLAEPVIIPCPGLPSARTPKELAVEAAKKKANLQFGYWKMETAVDRGMTSINERYFSKSTSGKSRYRSESKVYDSTGNIVRSSVTISNEAGTWLLFPTIRWAIRLPYAEARKRLTWEGPSMDAYDYSLTENYVPTPGTGDACLQVIMTLDVSRANQINVPTAALPGRMTLLISPYDGMIMAYSSVSANGRDIKTESYTKVSTDRIEDRLFEMSPDTSLYFSHTQREYNSALLHFSRLEQLSLRRNKKTTK